MPNKGKVPVLVVLILLSLLFAGGVGYLLQQEYAKNIALRAELERVLEKQKLTEVKLKDSQDLALDLETKLQEAKAEVGTLTSQLEEEKKVKEEALNQTDSLRVELEEQKLLKSGLETKLNEAQRDINKLQGQLKSLESQKVELEKKIEDLQAEAQASREAVQSTQTGKEGVELGKIIVNPEGAASKVEKASGSIPALEGKVLVVNKDYNFAVINLGSKDGVNIGDKFSLYRKDKYIGDLNVERIHDSMSAVAFGADIRDKISEGEKVTRINK